MAVRRETMKRMDRKRRRWLTLGIVIICVVVLIVVGFFRS